MQHILDILKERGFLAQITFEEDLYKALEKEPMTFYLGIDPRRTACTLVILFRSSPPATCRRPGIGRSSSAAAVRP